LSERLSAVRIWYRFYVELLLEEVFLAEKVPATLTMMDTVVVTLANSFLSALLFQAEVTA
jgi:hypothetical protein